MRLSWLSVRRCRTHLLAITLLATSVTECTAKADENPKAAAAPPHDRSAFDLQLPPREGLIISKDELAALPTSGPAWNRMKATADADLGTPLIADFEGDHDVRTLAVALVYARTGGDHYRAKAAGAILSAIGTEEGGLAVQLGRNLVSYVIAADLIDLGTYDPAGDARFREWLTVVRWVEFPDGSLIREDHKRANNHGRVAGVSRLAASLYLGDTSDVATAVAIFRGWLGDEDHYNGFVWKEDPSWQADLENPAGINAAGATKDGYSVDGAIPDEMRRGCPFQFPPCHTEYPWGALQATLLVAEMLDHLGFDAWEWEDRALLRAATFLHETDHKYGGWWARSDHAWQPWLINHAYGTDFPTEPLSNATLGKTFHWTDWLYGPQRKNPSGASTCVHSAPTSPTCPKARARPPPSVS